MIVLHFVAMRSVAVVTKDFNDDKVAQRTKRVKVIYLKVIFICLLFEKLKNTNSITKTLLRK